MTPIETTFPVAGTSSFGQLTEYMHDIEGTAARHRT
jgi:hypothetical protein